MLSAQSRAASAEEVESIPMQGSREDAPGCWRSSFPHTEAKPEARGPRLGQGLLWKGMVGVAVGEAGRALLSSSPREKVHQEGEGKRLGVGIPSGRSHLLGRLRLASTEGGQSPFFLALILRNSSWSRLCSHHDSGMLRSSELQT